MIAAYVRIGYCGSQGTVRWTKYVTYEFGGRVAG